MRGNSEDWFEARRRKEGIIVETLLDSKVTGLVMSEEFARNHRFRRMK